jgi:hypothetical protein
MENKKCKKAVSLGLDSVLDVVATVRRRLPFNAAVGFVETWHPT